MVKFTENKDLALKSDNWVITFFGDKEQEGFRRKVGKLMLAKNCVTNEDDWKDVLRIGETYFMHECNHPKIILEYVLNGFNMEMVHDNKLYGCKNKKPFKLVNPIDN